MLQKEFYTLNEVLLSFDSTERKGFYDYEVVEAINKLPKDIRDLNDAQYEILAFSFSENAEKYWGTFYGPRITWKRKDTGEDIYIHLTDQKFLQMLFLTGKTGPI